MKICSRLLLACKQVRPSPAALHGSVGPPCNGYRRRYPSGAWAHLADGWINATSSSGPSRTSCACHTSSGRRGGTGRRWKEWGAVGTKEGANPHDLQETHRNESWIVKFLAYLRPMSLSRTTQGFVCSLGRIRGRSSHPVGVPSGQLVGLLGETLAPVGGSGLGCGPAAGGLAHGAHAIPAQEVDFGRAGRLGYSFCAQRQICRPLSGGLGSQDLPGGLSRLRFLPVRGRHPV